MDYQVSTAKYSHCLIGQTAQGEGKAVCEGRKGKGEEPRKHLDTTTLHLTPCCTLVVLISKKYVLKRKP